MKTTAEIAREAGCTPGTIMHRAKVRGVTPAVRYGVSVWTAAQAKKLVVVIPAGRPAKIKKPPTIS